MLETRSPGAVRRPVRSHCAAIPSETATGAPTGHMPLRVPADRAAVHSATPQRAGGVSLRRAGERAMPRSTANGMDRMPSCARLRPRPRSAATVVDTPLAQRNTET